MKFDSYEFVHHAGRVQPAESVGIPLDFHALHFGTAAFEALRVLPGGLDGAPYLLAWGRHFDRLRVALEMLGVEPVAEPVLRSALTELVAAGNLRDGYLRLLVYPDCGGARLNPAGAPTGFSILGWRTDCEDPVTPLSLEIAALRQPSAEAGAGRAKLSGNYALAAISVGRAQRHGFDDAIKLHTDGTVCEATGANLFVVQAGKLVTPEIRDSIDGTTRGLVMAMAADLGLAVEVGTVTLADLEKAEEVFLTGTFFGVCPVRKIGEQSIGTGEPGPITTQLKGHFRAWCAAPETGTAASWLDSLQPESPPESDRPSVPPAGVRPAVGQDLEFVVEGMRALLAELRNQPSPAVDAATRDLCVQWIEGDAAGMVLVAEPPGDGDPVGFLILGFPVVLRSGGRIAVIQDLWVRGDARNSGAGAALVAAARAASRARGVRRMEVGLPKDQFASLARTQGFYLSCGFERLGPRMRCEVGHD